MHKGRPGSPPESGPWQGPTRRIRAKFVQNLVPHPGGLPGERPADLVRHTTRRVATREVLVTSHPQVHVTPVARAASSIPGPGSSGHETQFAVSVHWRSISSDNWSASGAPFRPPTHAQRRQDRHQRSRRRRAGKQFDHELDALLAGPGSPCPRSALRLQPTEQTMPVVGAAIGRVRSVLVAVGGASVCLVLAGRSGGWLGPASPRCRSGRGGGERRR